jgi:hypothetical protein
MAEQSDFQEFHFCSLWATLVVNPNKEELTLLFALSDDSVWQVGWIVYEVARGVVEPITILILDQTGTLRHNPELINGNMMVPVKY